MNARHNCKKPRWAVFATICAAALAMPLFADPVHIDSADYECSFNVKFAGYKGVSTLTDFPVLIRLSAELNEFKYAKCVDGASLRFADSDGNLIPHEIDTWDPSGTSLVWVKVPSLTRSAVIKVYYGYRGSGTPPAVTASDVWSNGYVGVWHMGAERDSATQSDSTANPITVAKNRSDNAYQDGTNPGVAGKIGKAAEFHLRSDGKGGYFGKDTNGKLDGFESVTIEAWTCQRELYNNFAYLLSKRSGEGNSTALRSYRFMNQNNVTRPVFFFYYNVTNVLEEISHWPGSPNPALNTWYHQAHLYNGATGYKAWFLDGESKSSSTTAEKVGTLNSLVNGDVFIGNWDDQWSGGSFPGSMDEVRISSVARSADWIKASHDAVANEDFASYETAENDWSKYGRRFTVSFPGVPEGVTLEDFPVLVKLAEYDAGTGAGVQGFSYADCIRSNGGDIRFADEDGNMLACEIDTWDDSGTSLVWVKVPSLTASTKITAYYGWTLAPRLASSSVWDSGFIGVWHLGDGGVSQSDSTANARDMLCRQYTDGIDPTVSGLVGGAVEFNKGETSYGALTLLDPKGGFDGLHALTLEAWTYQNHHDPGTAEKSGHILKCGRGGVGDVFHMYEANTGVTSTYLSTTTNGVTFSQFISNSSVKPERARWNYQVRKYDGDTARLGAVLNGIPLGVDSWCYGTGCTGIVATVSGTRFYIGNTWDDSYGTTPFPGKIDEVRVSRVFRSDEWLKATYDTIADNATFTTYGPVKDNGRRGLIIFLR